MICFRLSTFQRTLGVLLALGFSAGRAAAAAEAQNLNVLFIGNSFTGRHNLSQVVKSMAEAGNPGLRFEVTTVIYGGRTLKDHWRLGTQNFVNLASVGTDQVRATIKSLQEAVTRDAKDTYAATAIKRQQELLASLSQPHRQWDVVVLQSYRDDTQGEQCAYVEYAPQFAALVKGQGGRVILYETTPDTQNATALAQPPDPAPVHAKAKIMARLAARTGATLVPMSKVALHCQTVRPDLTLRFVNDAHLNQTMAYLTACTFYAALFNRSPVGLPVDRVKDIRFLDAKQKNKDRDGLPITKVFSAQERADLQRIAWAGFQQFQKFAATSR